MSEKTFGWKTQLSVGQRGEKLFQETYPKSTQTDGRIDDFILDGERIELKSDSYEMSKTSNVFLEFYGNTDKKSVGGPWRTAQDDIKWFVYLFLHDKKFFWYESKKLVKFLDEHIKTLKPKIVRNKGYDTCGFAVSREAIKHLERDKKS